jgi:hypothetical protein
VPVDRLTTARPPGVRGCRGVAAVLRSYRRSRAGAYVRRTLYHPLPHVRTAPEAHVGGVLAEVSGKRHRRRQTASVREVRELLMAALKRLGDGR